MDWRQCRLASERLNWRHCIHQIDGKMTQWWLEMDFHYSFVWIMHLHPRTELWNDIWFDRLRGNMNVGIYFVCLFGHLWNAFDLRFVILERFSRSTDEQILKVHSQTLTFLNSKYECSNVDFMDGNYIWAHFPRNEIPLNTEIRVFPVQSQSPTQRIGLAVFRCCQNHGPILQIIITDIEDKWLLPLWKFRAGNWIKVGWFEPNISKYPNNIWEWIKINHASKLDDFVREHIWEIVRNTRELWCRR